MQYKSTTRHPKTQDLTNKPFGQLTVIAFAGYTSTNAYWCCKCTCGVIKDVRVDHLTHGDTQSCGCQKYALTSQQKTTHGLTLTPEYKAWQQMFVRCYSPKSQSYANYGARGITVCESWHGSFETFFADMGPRPTPQHSLERIDNNQGYSPENCRWATMKEQSHNRRTNRLITHNGVTHTLSEWAESVGLSLQAFRQRLLRWSMEDALSTPVRPLTPSDIPTTFTYNGITQTLAEWAKQYNMSYTTLYRRILRGATLEKALTQPIAEQRRPKNSY
jgi:hypothetical protein